jgi:3-oxoacyl-[acyl-carrier-protein] synthase-3
MNEATYLELEARFYTSLCHPQQLTAPMFFFASALPTAIVSNATIEARLSLPEGWIETRTGIRERRYHSGGLSELGVEAAKQVLHHYSLGAQDIDVVILSTVTPDNPWPATACKIAHAIGATQAWAFDLSAACSGFLYSLEMTRALLMSGLYKNILLINGDCMSSVIDPMDKNTSIVFGDGCSASLWNKDTISCIKYMKLETDGSDYDKIIVPNGGSALRNLEPAFLHMEGKATFKLAIQRMSQGMQELLDHNGLTFDDIDYIVPHQANMRIIQAIIDYVKVDGNKVLTNLQWLGNTTNATIPLCLAHHADKFKSGQKLLLCAFGAGTTWGTALVEVP